jgi:hypothetical protein
VHDARLADLIREESWRCFDGSNTALLRRRDASSLAGGPARSALEALRR